MAGMNTEQMGSREVLREAMNQGRAGLVSELAHEVG